ncbi:NAD(P)-dependent oxidoreductase [Pontiellaceae bacterium B12227]|nr:NAD(P)-dependent oxidoreductase [Pontiellaceae bacterium B12227]
MNRIMVTGAGGFLGSACLKQLVKDETEIYAIDLKKSDSSGESVQWCDVDLQNQTEVDQLFRETKPDKLLHLAWGMNRAEGGSFSYASESHLSWIEAGLNIARAFEAAGGRRMVVSGTCFEYDHDGEICKEGTTPLLPQNNYGKSKHELQSKLHAFCEEMSLSYAWGRVFLLYGPNENPNRLIPHVIRSILAGNPVKTTHGNQVRDYLFVEDVASALVALLDSSLTGPVNICSGEGTRLKDIIRYIAKVLDGEHLLHIGAIEAPAHEVGYLIGDNTLLVENTEWIPRYDLNTGLERTIESIQKELKNVGK